MTPLRGVDITVRPDLTAVAIDSIVDTATEQGFVEQDSTAVNAARSSSGSEWRIRHLLIGDTQRSWINGIVNDIFSPFTCFQQR